MTPTLGPGQTKMELASNSQHALTAIQSCVDQVASAKAAFNVFDRNLSGRVSADELAEVLTTMGVSIDEAKAEEMIKTINERYGLERKVLTLDVFCQAFRKGNKHGGLAVQRL